MDLFFFRPPSPSSPLLAASWYLDIPWLDVSSLHSRSSTFDHKSHVSHMRGPVHFAICWADFSFFACCRFFCSSCLCSLYTLHVKWCILVGQFSSQCSWLWLCLKSLRVRLVTELSLKGWCEELAELCGVVQMDPVVPMAPTSLSRWQVVRQRLGRAVLLSGSEYRWAPNKTE